MLLGEEEQEVVQQHAEARGRNSRRSKEALGGEQQELMLVEEQGLILCVWRSSRSISW